MRDGTGGSPLPRTVWRVWVGPSALRPLQEAALRSCARDTDFPTRLVTDGDIPQLLGKLHPGFHLLDPVQKADYLRCELLHKFGGFYLDLDVFCLRSLRTAYDASQGFDASGATLRSEYVKRGAGLVIESNAMGPFRPNTTYTRAWRAALLRKMDSSLTQLQACAAQSPDGHGGVAYRSYLQAVRNRCGFEWAAMMTMKRRLRK